MMAEIDIENALIELLSSENSMGELKIESSNTHVKTMKELISGIKFKIYHNTSEWNQDSHQMKDIIGGMTPDLVLRSNNTNQNRIYIEVKEKSPLNYEAVDSQVVRYFLHLLATTEQNPKGKSDISRAVLLAAPEKWFANAKNEQSWSYFKCKYSEIASKFGITIGEIITDRIVSVA